MAATLFCVTSLSASTIRGGTSLLNFTQDKFHQFIDTTPEHILKINNSVLCKSPRYNLTWLCLTT